MRDRHRPSATAYHEAGHAVACWAFGIPIRFASIIADPAIKAGGEVRHAPGVPHHQRIVISFAGPAAQRRSHPRSAVAVGARWDRGLAEMTAEVLFDAMHSRRSFLRSTAAQARAVIDQHWFAVDGAARALTARRAMSGHAIVKVIGAADEEWRSALAHDPRLDPYGFARIRAVAAQGLPRLGYAHLSRSALRATMARAPDIEAAIVADLTNRGFAEAAVLSLLSRARRAAEHRS